MFLSISLIFDRHFIEYCWVEILSDFMPAPLGNLPTAQREFTQMFVLSNRDLKEIATQAGISDLTVRSRFDNVINARLGELWGF